METSSRHHYIPRFYIKGFTNNDQLLFVYDKQNDRIQQNISPKGIFYERDRNTMYFDEATSILEDKWYQQLDDRCSQAIRNLREEPNIEGILSNDNLADIQFFVLCLFWRIPKTDYAFERYIREAKIGFTDNNGEDFDDIDREHSLKNDVNYKKIARAFISNQALKNFTQIQGQIHAQLFDKGRDLFLLGDYPMVFKKTPSTFDDLFHTDFYLPISSKRLFYSARNQRELKFEFGKILRINALVIDQSVRYICSPNLEYLRDNVTYYKRSRAEGVISLLHDEVFNK